MPLVNYTAASVRFFFPFLYHSIFFLFNFFTFIISKEIPSKKVLSLREVLLVPDIPFPLMAHPLHRFFSIENCASLKDYTNWDEIINPATLAFLWRYSTGNRLEYTTNLLFPTAFICNSILTQWRINSLTFTMTYMLAEVQHIAIEIEAIKMLDVNLFKIPCAYTSAHHFLMDYWLIIETARRQKRRRPSVTDG